MAGKKTHRNVFIYGGIAATVMFAFCFALVPLYSLICKKTGINTSLATDLISPAKANEISKSMDLSREITVQFTSTNHMGMPWDFYPVTKMVKVHPGERKKIYFHAMNTTVNDMVALAIPSMTPTDAIAHFHKIECFCFNQQKLKAKESREMGMIFQIDKDLPKEINVITLAYTLFDATPKAAKKG